MVGTLVNHGPGLEPRGAMVLRPAIRVLGKR
jgi:hypothetical protein